MKKVKNLNSGLAISMLLLAIVSTAAGRTITVDNDGPSDFNEIQPAINAANYGDTVVVASGRYVGAGNRLLDFGGKAITVISRDGPSSTIIESYNISVVVFDDNEGPNAIFQGFTIGWGTPAIVIANASPTIVGNVITGRIVTGGGSKSLVAGIEISGNSSPAILENTITGNVASSAGGSQAVGAIRVSGGASPIITRNIITRNVADVGGSGMAVGAIIVSPSSSAIIHNNIISKNSAIGGGGCTVAAGILVFAPSENVIMNNTIANNGSSGMERSILVGGAASLKLCPACGGTLSQCPECQGLKYVLQAHGGGCLIVDDLYAKGTYSLIGSGITDGVGNITGNPLFVNPLESDYHILPGSPCINAGDPDYAAEPNETDLDGLPRVIDGRVDMGVYEYPNISPVACIVGTDRIVECEGCWGARITLDGSCSSDAGSTPGTNDDIASFDWYKVDASDPNFVDFLGSGEIIDCNIPVGEHIIVLEVIDKAGTFDTNEVSIIIQDTAPPEFSLSVNPTTLWPPNKKMVMITPSWTVSDKCDAMPAVSLVSISINEGGTNGNGQTEDDVKIGDDGSIYLRAKRNRASKERIYTITYRVVDDCENTTVRSATVTVPHKRR
ncbi:MAG: right-handed parallel beta-helix repeat-containing protein [Planctomycetota bacterium]|jgi:hypothetical protein